MKSFMGFISRGSASKVEFLNFEVTPKGCKGVHKVKRFLIEVLNVVPVVIIGGSINLE